MNKAWTSTNICPQTTVEVEQREQQPHTGKHRNDSMDKSNTIHIGVPTCTVHVWRYRSKFQNEIIHVSLSRNLNVPEYRGWVI